MTEFEQQVAAGFTPSAAAVAAALREGRLRRLSPHETANDDLLEAQIAASVRAAYAIDAPRVAEALRDKIDRAISLLQQAACDDGGPDYDHALTARHVRAALAVLRGETA